jgi:hypothetical protein
MTSIIIDRRYCGPPNSGNGGYVSGRLARHISGGAEVTLHAPPPLDKRLDVVATGDGPKEKTWQLRDGAVVVATARPASVELTRLEAANFDEAAAAQLRTPVKPHEHLLPSCFVCGPARTPGDGLRIFAGPLEGQSGTASPVLAAAWTPDPNLAAADGLVGSEFLWSALDCPTGYAAAYDSESGQFDRTPILLGRISARIETRPYPGERCVITAWETGRDGRKRFAEAAAYGDAGTLLAVARATWIAVDRLIPLGRTFS